MNGRNSELVSLTM